MHSMPFHTDEYVRLIEVVLLKFYEKCYQRFYCKFFFSTLYDSAAWNLIFFCKFIATVARGSSYSDQQKNVTDITISTSGDWAQDESLVGLLAQNPFFNDDSVIYT